VFHLRMRHRYTGEKHIHPPRSSGLTAVLSQWPRAALERKDLIAMHASMMPRTGPLTAALLALILPVCGTGAAHGASPGGTDTLARKGGALDLSGVCPAAIDVQMDWQPEAEHGVWYSLIGDGYTVDADKKRVTGNLTAQGKDTGVDLSVRTGGAAISFQPVSAAMYTDHSIDIGQVATDEAIQFSAKQPTLAVMAPFEISPLGLMWDPATYPQVKTIKDLGKSDAKILYNEAGGSYPIEYLVGAGVLKRSQLDSSYDGSPAPFVAADGKSALQGFATAEPYLYENEIKSWGKPLKFALYYDAGYQPYNAAISIRAGDKKKLTPCLKKLIPIVQQAQIDYMKNPDRAVGIILEAVDKYNTGWVYSEEAATYALKKMDELKLIGNSKNGTVGEFDPARVQRTIDIVTPILAKRNIATKNGLTVGDLTTNEFIEKNIGF
ncbi:hypothetical protein ACWCQZ_51010, partial [Streptomyces sp. NPDC002285]